MAALLPRADGEAALLFRLMCHRFLVETAAAYLEEQCAGAASEFAEAAWRTFAACAAEADWRTGAAAGPGLSGGKSPGWALLASFARDAAGRCHAGNGAEERMRFAAAIEKVARKGLEQLIARADLRAVEEICEELLSAVYRWNGESFVITARRAAEAQALVRRCGGIFKERRGKTGVGIRLPAEITAVKTAFKIAAAVLILHREPDDGMMAALKEGYAALAGYTAVENAEEELKAEIGLFCRTLEVLRGE